MFELHNRKTGAAIEHRGAPVRYESEAHALRVLESNRLTDYYEVVPCSR